EVPRGCQPVDQTRQRAIGWKKDCRSKDEDIFAVWTNPAARQDPRGPNQIKKARSRSSVLSLDLCFGKFMRPQLTRTKEESASARRTVSRFLRNARGCCAVRRLQTCRRTSGDGRATQTSGSLFCNGWPV